ncbi:probable kinetochore protein Spc24p [[Candida] railenensis]|uniref:Kinetochore protein Spc24 n=1 Tax=[Candida] railenensis TaxID=45579 RepID=A0A9P0QMD4_9ASCO|nr:probable kinetochore protein Spc24p [[Candida] railenensis]
MSESYPAILNSVVDSFEIKPDLVMLSKIDESIQKSSIQRSLKLEQQQSILNQLQKEYDSLLKEANSLSDPSSSEDILAQLEIKTVPSVSPNDNLFDLFDKKSIELDNSKVVLAKRINELDSQINLKKINISKLHEQLEKVTQQTENVLNENLLQNPDSKIMKINLYKSLGILIENGTNGVDEDKILLYNKENDLTSILNVNDKYSDYFITNHIWDRL